ncbi:hypothetical protein QSJ18_10280 [Gordonia sp. ABSL1-1]|uniref:hypothetical protein n=1 Tax=Gordonia sp. ABSL1-1 TaxID=3053923 RepID=UPI0025733A23|nr:hypothetical protein [Gordonia sp. ABSL1-1]MDL9937129.1 hypothetical protein [Gordonia sp. ABSL1-1]
MTRVTATRIRGRSVTAARRTAGGRWRAGTRAFTAVAAGALSLAVAAIPAGPAAAAPVPINGVLSISAGSCAGGSATGSFFRMILPEGSSSGPFLANGESACSDKTITLLAPGTDGGLRSGGYQPQPGQAFDAQGNALSGSVTRPVKFYGVGFATATNPQDPQTGRSTSTPRLYIDGTRITGDLSAFGVTWNKQVFNQGSPKPGGQYSGKTTPVRGQYDAATGTYVIEWTSQIVGGPFNNFTGLWHLTGRVSGAHPAAAPAPVTPGQGTGAAPAPGVPGQPAPVPADPRSGVTPQAVAPAAAQAPPTVANNVIVKADKSDDLTANRWFVAALVLLTVIATAVLTNADRLFGRVRRNG